jgi:preprotein translocase subunit SecF
MNIIKHRNIFFTLAGLLLALSIISVSVFGLKFGVDFTGGSVLEISGTTATMSQISDALSTREHTSVTDLGNHSFRITTSVIDQVSKDTIIASLATITGDTFTENKFVTIGPSVGSEIRYKAILCIIIIAIALVLFIAYAFRNVARPVSSWAYGLITLVVLLHDVLIPSGIFALLGHEVTPLFIIGILTILGVSVNDTIVVFDRIRENLKLTGKNTGDFAALINTSIKQTFVRSLLTATTVLLALLALWIWGPVATRDLALVMFLGMFFGTYSSIFLASPLLVVYNNWQNRK